MDILKVAVKNNIRLLDTASLYGDSEKLIGNLIGNKEIWQMLQERCYIVKNDDQFNNIPELYKSGKIPSKFDEKFVDNFIYPIHQ